MQFLRATTRQINKDRLYQSQHVRRKSIDLQKTQLINSNNLLPLKTDSTTQKKFRKVKSVSKIFGKQEQKLNQWLENKTLLTKLTSVQSTLKPLRIKQTPKTDCTSRDQDQRKKKTQILRRQNEILTKKYQEISESNLITMKESVQKSIKEYLQLRESISKMRALSATPTKGMQMNPVEKKIVLRFPKQQISNIKDSNSQQQHLSQKIEKYQTTNIAKQRYLQKNNDSHQQNIFTEVLKLRQLKKLNFFKDSKTIKEKTITKGDFQLLSSEIVD